MMIRDQHLDAAFARRGDAADARDAVVDGDDERRRALRGQPHDLGRQAITELEAIGHQEVHRREAPAAQAAHDERGAGGAVGIEVADHHDAAFAILEDQLDGALDAFERTHRHQSVEGQREFAVVTHTARGIGAPQHRMQARVEHLAVRVCATFDDHIHRAIMPSWAAHRVRGFRASLGDDARNSSPRVPRCGSSNRWQ